LLPVLVHDGLDDKLLPVFGLDDFLFATLSRGFACVTAAWLTSVVIFCSLSLVVVVHVWTLPASSSWLNFNPKKANFTQDEQPLLS
jgi:hypothetical protein